MSDCDGFLFGGTGGGDITDEALKAKFVETDTDGSGALDATELHNLFESMGKPVSVDTLTNLIKLTVRPRSPNHSRLSRGSIPLWWLIWSWS